MNIKGDCADIKIPKVTLFSHKDIAFYFFSMFQEGVLIKTEVGLNVRKTIKNVFNKTDEFIEKRISTILLDGKVVDDIDRATVKEGSVLALSGAMPGLVGATMRTHSVYESFREAITYIEKDRTHDTKTGIFTIKLFNILLGELAHKALNNGIILPAWRLKKIIEGFRDVLDNIRPTFLDQNGVDPSLTIEKLIGNHDGLIEIELHITGKQENDR